MATNTFNIALQPCWNWISGMLIHPAEHSIFQDQESLKSNNFKLFQVINLIKIFKGKIRSNMILLEENAHFGQNFLIIQWYFHTITRIRFCPIPITFSEIIIHFITNICSWCETEETGQCFFFNRPETPFLKVYPHFKIQFMDT